MKKARFGDLVIGIAFMLLGVFVYFEANKLSTVKLGIGPGGFPRFIAVFIELLGIAMTISVLRSGFEKPEVKIEKKALALLFGAIACCVVYVNVLPTVGFLLATPVLLFAMMMLYGNRRYGLCAVISVITTIVIWVLFTKIFLIFLPACRLF